MKYIYVLSSCNEWKEWSSRDIILVTTSIRKLRKELKERAKKGDMKVGNEDTFNYLMNGNLPPRLIERELNDILECGMVEVWED